MICFVPTKRTTTKWPFLAATVVLLVTVYILYVKAISLNNGKFVYLLDDAYIHLAMAKNFASHGTWGITKYEFTFSSSSPLWTFILSVCFHFFGVTESIPLFLNLSFGVGILWLLYLRFSDVGFSANTIFALLVLISFLAPFPTLALMGLEHLAHIFFALLFLRELENTINKSSSSILVLCITSALLGLVRYESMFIIFSAVIILLLHRRKLESLLCLTSGFLPLGLIGLYAVMKGWYLLPNSVLLKGRSHQLYDLESIINFLGREFLIRLMDPPELGLIFMLCLTLFFIKLFLDDIDKALSIRASVFFATTFLHLQLTSVRQFFRYEAYLIVIGAVLLVILMKSLLLRINSSKLRKPLLLVIYVFFLVFSYRIIASLSYSPQASNNIFLQQYQIAKFIQQFYPTCAVAASDIGAICFYSDIRLFDILGLAQVDVARALRNNTYNNVKLGEMVEQFGAKIAVTHEFVLNLVGGKPPSWVPVGYWKIPNNIVCASDKVTFYAVSQSEVGSLSLALKEFSKQLPEEVIRKYLVQ